MSSPSGMAAPWRVYLGTFGVFLGVGIVSLRQRLLSVGLPDLRGALGLGFDEAAWIPTVYDMSLMFMGSISVYLGGLLGRREVLLWAGGVFTVASIALPLAPAPGGVLALQLVAGLASGTFYPLALSFALTNLPPRHAIYAIGAFSMDLLSSLSIGTPLMGWFAEHASWRWIFWTGAVLTPVMMLCVFSSVPPRPRRDAAMPPVNWHGFLFFSIGFSLVEGALEQGERLDWLGSGAIRGMLIAGALLFFAGAVQRWRSPNPLINLSFLARRNLLLVGAGAFTLRFVLLAILVLVPGYLAEVQGFRPEETGRVLLWLTIPALLMGLVAAQLMKWIDGRLIAAIALAGVATACLMDARLSPSWASDQFWWPQLVVAGGLAFYSVGQIGLQVQESMVSGIRVNPINAMTFSAYSQTLRLFGGQVGSTLMGRLLFVRTVFHRNALGRSVEAGAFLTEERLQAIAASLLPGSSGPEEAQGRAAIMLMRDLARQASTLAYMDGFILIAWVCVGMMVLLACMKSTRNVFSEKEVAGRSRSSGPAAPVVARPGGSAA